MVTFLVPEYGITINVGVCVCVCVCVCGCDCVCVCASSIMRNEAVPDLSMSSD